MSFFEMLGALLIGPLKLLFEIIFAFANRFVNHPGLSIIFLSLVMNILVLPLYKRADAMQEKARDTDARLHNGVAHIKKVFSGDEKMMILQTYYRQNNYKPTDALNGSVSLLLEIPFFLAAYQFLSHLETLKGVSLGPIKNLGAPDGILVIGGLAINVLPFLMTFINFISSALYLKGFPLKTKIQLYGMATFFLIFLYASPSGLVFYWTLNNLFSLVKTVFYKLKNPRKVLSMLTSAVGMILLIFAMFFYNAPTFKYKLFLIVLGLALQLPLLSGLIKSNMPSPLHEKKFAPNKKVFLIGCIFLTVFIGLMIPSTFIAASPQEYIDITYFHNPLWYIVKTVCMAAGTFLVWMRVFYWLASDRGKVMFDRIICVLCGTAVIDFTFFGTKLGVISPTLKYEKEMVFSIGEQLLNIAVIAIAIAAIYYIATHWMRIIVPVLLACTLTFTAMTGIRISSIKTSVNKVSARQSVNKPSFTLSKSGKNVVILMLDRAMGEYIPYLFNENPKLKKQFEGFTYYSNTVSFGGFTNFATPAFFGGYEYTPVEMNKRSSEALVSKHNEALKVMPGLFSKHGFDVTVCDPTYANYNWVPDLSIYKQYPDIKAFITNGYFGNTDMKKQVIVNNQRNFFCFSIMKSLPLCLQPSIYTNGTYNQNTATKATDYQGQKIHSLSTAEGLSPLFMNAYNVLTNMQNITKVTNDKNNTFLVLTNDTTHNPMMLQEPEYIPASSVDNTEFDAKNTSRFEHDGKKLDMSSEELQITHYQTNMAALIQVGKWLDYLREQDVYDNSRIIIAADHGRPLRHNKDLIMGDTLEKDVEFFYPLLLVKDFNSKKWSVSDKFMTNADIPTIATAGLIDKPVNPFTGKEISDKEKTAHDQYIIISSEFGVDTNNGNTFKPSKWAKVKDDMHDKNNWKFYDKEVVLKNHAFPDASQN